jgi:hypothetical protein
MSRKTVLLGLLIAGLLALAIAACGARQIPSQLTNNTYFAEANLFLNKGQLISLNYRSGTPLPLGTQVTVNSVTAEQIHFTLVDTGMQYVFINHRATGTDIQANFQRFFGTEDPDDKLLDLTPEEQDQVHKALPAVGMSRAAVLLAIGPPPSHKTPTLDAPIWTYWNNRATTFEVHFGADGLVEKLMGSVPGAVAPPPEAPAAEEPQEIMYARCNVRHVEGETSWLNIRNLGAVINFNTKVEIVKKGGDSVDFKNAETGFEYEFENDPDKSGLPGWEMFLKYFAVEDQASRLDALSEKDKKGVLGAEVKKGMSKDAVEMAWCPPPPHGTPSLAASKWTYWTNRINKLEVHFTDDDTVKKIKQ